MPSNRLPRGAVPPLLAFALVALAQLPLILNPGYFSHDELQWAAFAADGASADWTAIDQFQYRPLTFQAWLWLSRLLFDVPQAFHAVLVAAGAANAALAAVLARRMGAAPWPALAGAVLFGVGPHAMYVHGWIGTLGDVLWLGLGLLAALLATWRRLPPVGGGLAAAAATLAALLAKEAAVAIPALFALGAWLAARPGDDLRRRLAIAAIATGAVVAAYLALRIGTLLDAPRSGSAYSLSPLHVPVRWLEQQLFPFDPVRFELHTVLEAPGSRTVVAGGVWLGVVGALALAGWRWPLAFVLAGIAALAPALPLAAGANQYGYGFACVASLVAACAWPRVPVAARAVLLFAALLVAWHGVNVVRQVRAVGERQARFSPALADALRERRGPVRLRMGEGADEWIYRRLTHDIPHYDGVRMGDRVHIVAPGDAADLVVERDGTLVPAR